MRLPFDRRPTSNAPLPFGHWPTLLGVTQKENRDKRLMGEHCAREFFEAKQEGRVVLLEKREDVDLRIAKVHVVAGHLDCGLGVA